MVVDDLETLFLPKTGSVTTTHTHGYTKTLRIQSKYYVASCPSKYEFLRTWVVNMKDFRSGREKVNRSRQDPYSW